MNEVQLDKKEDPVVCRDITVQSSKQLEVRLTATVPLALITTNPVSTVEINPDKAVNTDVVPSEKRVVVVEEGELTTRPFI